MEQINDFQVLKAEMDRKFKKGVVTNLTANSEALRAETACGNVSCVSTESNLFILRKRKDRIFLNFYINSFDEEVPGLLPNTVTELVFRDNDIDRQKAVTFLRKQGFVLKFFRKKLSRDCGSTFNTAGIRDLPENLFEFRQAGSKDLGTVVSVLYDSFDQLTACLPDEDEISFHLNDETSRDRYFILESEGRTAGIIHTVHGKNSFEIRHMAVQEQFRGNGYSSFMLMKINSIFPQPNSVWVNYSNIPARSLYMNHGYTDAGRKSAVLVYQGK